MALSSGRATAACALALLAACATNPATGRKELMLVSQSQEIEMGRQADQEAAASFGLYPDEALQAYLADLGRRMAARTERPTLPWTFRVVDDPTVNAFALPGGYVYLTRGILAHLGSEAEMMAVVGHEIGHVTARHSASQISRSQGLLGLLVVGMAVKPELQRFAGLAQTGLGLLFLKFGRDDEREADDLGLRYLMQQGYDPRQMLGVFATLDRVGSAAGAGRLPDWLSTHPSPGNRLERIQSRLPPGSEGHVEREGYLRHLQGLVFGDDPREGYFSSGTFFHPEMRFRLAFPRGFRTQNQKQAVLGGSPNEDAVVALTLARGSSPEEAAREFAAQEGMSAGPLERASINGLAAVSTGFEAVSNEQALRGRVAFVSHEGRIFRLVGYTPAARFDAYDRSFADFIRSFAPLRDRRYLDVEPARLDLVRVERATTLAEFLRAYPSTAPAESVAVINGLAADAALAPGQVVKRVVGGRRPE
jgi:predicted Zn-dependent protease